MTKNEVMKLITKLYQKNHKFPKIQEMSRLLGISYMKVQGYLKELVADGDLIMRGYRYDFPTEEATTSEVIPEPKPKVEPEPEPKPNPTPEPLPIPEPVIKPNSLPELKVYDWSKKEPETISESEAPPELNIREKEVEPEIKYEYEKSPTEEKVETPDSIPVIKKLNTNKWTVSLLRYIMGVIGTGAAILSIYFTFIWMRENLPFFMSLLLSIIMVGFSVFAFEIVILFFQRKGSGNKWIGSGFLFLWIIVAIFSITSTIAGQYNHYSSNITKQPLNTKWDSLLEEKRDLIHQLNSKRQLLSQYYKISGSVTDLNKANKAWSNLQTRIADLSTEIETLNNKVNVLRQKETQLPKKHHIPTFYDWLSFVFGSKPSLIQFLMALFPAIFIDVIAPAAWAIALFLKDEGDFDD